MPQFHHDRFNNLVCEFNSGETWNFEIIKPETKGVLFINIPSSSFEVPLESLFRRDGKTYTFWRRTSTAPKLIQGKIYSAICILLYKGHIFFVKDKYRPFLTLPGGTAEENEVVGFNEYNSRATLTREIQEELFVEFPENISKTKVAIINFQTPIFGHTVDDTCHVYVVNLFQESERLNEIIEKGQVSVSNNEIEKIIAFKIPYQTSLPLSFTKELIEEYRSNVDSSGTKVSFLQMFIVLQYFYGSKEYKKGIESISSGFPPSFRELNFIR